MNKFSGYGSGDDNVGEFIFETLLNSNIDSITDLNFSENAMLFYNSF